MSTRREYKLGALLSYAIIALNIASGFVFTPILMRCLGADYNLYQGVGAFAGYVALLDFGLGTVVIRYVAKYRAEGDRAAMERFLGMVLTLYTCIGALILAIGALGYRFLGNLFPNFTPEQLVLARRLFAVLVANVTFSMLFNIFPGVLAAYERFTAARTIGLSRLLLRAGLLMWLLVSGGGALRVMLLDTALNIGSMLAYAVYAMGRLKVRVRWRGFDRALLRDIFFFSLFIFLNMVMSEAYWNVDKTIMMRVALPLVIVTSTSGQIIQYFMEFSNVFSGLFLPRAVQVVARGADTGELTDLMIRVGRLQLMVVGLVVIGFGVAGRQFMTLWVGEALGGDVATCYAITLMLLLSLLVPLFQSSALSILQALNKHAFRAVVLFFISLLNVVVSVFLAKAYGPFGAALGTAFSLILGNVLISNWYYHYKIGLDIRRFFREGLRGILPALLLIATLSCATLWMPQNSWGWLLVRVAVIVAVYAVVMIRVGMNAGERALLHETLGGVLRHPRKWRDGA